MKKYYYPIAVITFGLLLVILSIIADSNELTLIEGLFALLGGVLIGHGLVIAAFIKFRGF